MSKNNERLVRACGYVRVSTEDQVAHGLSIPSQIDKIEKFCSANGWTLVDVVEEPGQSGKDIGRPKFNQMIGRATSISRPYDVIVVYALSRFARNLALQAKTCADLQLAGVELASVSETFGKGADGNLMRSVVGAFNQHTSDQCAMNTRRAMNANANEGFYNGGPVPFGYRSVVVERRKDKDKKRLAIHVAEADVVRCIFRLAEHGDGSGPLGVRSIAKWLNDRGYTLRGGRFHNSNTAAILCRTHYAGYYMDGKKNEYSEPLPEHEWITVPCPAVVTEEQFLNVAALRAKRSPKVTPPRQINGVTMLPATIARCGQPGCGSGLTVRTGKGGRYHYYTCSSRVKVSAQACMLKSIRREKLDKLVLDEVAARVFDRERLGTILSHLVDRSEEVVKRRKQDLALARAELTNADKAITNLLMTIESGAMRPDDPLFVQRMAHNKARKAALETDVQSLDRQIANSKVQINEEMIGAFAGKMAQALRDEKSRFRAEYIRLFIERVDLSDNEIRIRGTKAALERALIHSQISGDGSVPIFDREWCRLQDSNLWPHHYE